jgi:hypothetical protein
MTESTPKSAPGGQSISQRRASPNPNWCKEWYEFQQREDQRVLAELREKIGPDGDLNAAYRQWYAEQMREHDEGLILMLKNLHEREKLAAQERESPRRSRLNKRRQLRNGLLLHKHFTFRVN